MHTVFSAAPESAPRTGQVSRASRGKPGVWLLCCLLLAACPIGPAAAGSDRWEWPLDPRPAVVNVFDPPAHRYGAGHRGVDLAGRPGQPVRAVAAGTVSFAGRLAGRGVVVVDHGRLRSTYEPVDAQVAVGDVVAAGQLLGTLTSDLSHCLPSVCLHLGAKTASGYLDPLDLLGGGPIRLKPLAGDGPPAPGADGPSAGPTSSIAVRSGAAVALELAA